MLSSFFFHDKQPHVAEPSKDMVPTSLNMRRNGISRVRQALKFGTESGTLPRYLSSLGVLCFWEVIKLAYIEMSYYEESGIVGYDNQECISCNGVGVWHSCTDQSKLVTCVKS